MKKLPKDVFLQVAVAESAETAITELPDQHLGALILFLKDAPVTALAATIHGLAIIEGGRRFTLALFPIPALVPTCLS